MLFCKNYVVTAIIGAGEGLIVGSFVVFALQLVGALTLGRLFCGWICPVAGLQEACPISLEVAKMVQAKSMLHTECILCGSCADNCPHGVIRYSFGSTG